MSDPKAVEVAPGLFMATESHSIFARPTIWRECGCFEHGETFWRCCACRGQTESQRKADEDQHAIEAVAMNGWVSGS